MGFYKHCPHCKISIVRLLVSERDFSLVKKCDRFVCGNFCLSWRLYVFCARHQYDIKEHLQAHEEVQLSRNFHRCRCSGQVEHKGLFWAADFYLARLIE